MANRNSNFVTVRLNNKSGNLSTRSDFPVPQGCVALTAFDMDSDGDQDLAVVSIIYSNVYILRNNGSGSFTMTEGHNTGLDPASVVAGDLDGDGDLDLVTANTASDSCTVFLNNGSGSFSRLSHYIAGDDPISVALADLDADGDIDIAVSNSGTDNIYVLRNKIIQQQPVAIAALSPANYQTGILQPGVRLYLDRTYDFKSPIPAEILYRPYILTRQADRDLSGSSVVRFDVSAPVWVYVLLAEARTTPPSWLAGWQKTSLRVVTTDPAPNRVAYRRRFPVGQVTLGGNWQTGFPTGVSMYNVVVVPYVSSADAWSLYQ